MTHQEIINMFALGLTPFIKIIRIRVVEVALNKIMLKLILSQKFKFKGMFYFKRINEIAVEFLFGST